MREQKNRTVLALAAAVLSALGASLCCIVPLAAAALGVAGFGVSEFLAPWRPYLLAITFSLLALGFYLAYRPQPEQACMSSRKCEHQPVRRWSRRGVWVATVPVIAFSAFPYFGGHLLRALSRRSQPVVTVERSDNARLTLKIEGMDCPVCAEALQNRLREIPGVNRAEVSFRTKQATLSYDPQRAHRRDFVRTITDAGFKASGSPHAKD